MILPHLLALETYRNSWASKTGFKILDNGANEGVTTSAEDLISLARSVNAHEIVAPDVLYNYKETTREIYKFLEHRAVSKWEGGIIAVVQGSSMTEWLNCIERYAEEEAITTIALPRLLLNLDGVDVRLRLAESIRTMTDKEIHCLGAGKWVEEVRDLNAQGIVRGLDTSLPYVYAKADIELLSYDNEFVSRGDHTEFFMERLTVSEAALAYKNVETYLKIAGVYAQTPFS